MWTPAADGDDILQFSEPPRFYPFCFFLFQNPGLLLRYSLPTSLVGVVLSKRTKGPRIVVSPLDFAENGPELPVLLSEFARRSIPDAAVANDILPFPP